MKKLMSGACLLALCLIISCKDSTNTSTETSTQSNATAYKDANAKVYRAIETGDVSALDSVIAEDAVDHGDPSGREVRGRDSIKAALAQVHNMFSNLKIEVLNSATDNDICLERVRMTGTCNMDMPEMGMVKGKNIDMTTVDVTKWKDGKATEHWAFINQQDMMKMPPPPPPKSSKAAGKDTAAKR